MFVMNKYKTTYNQPFTFKVFTSYEFRLFRVILKYVYDQGISPICKAIRMLKIGLGSVNMFLTFNILR